MDLGEKSFLFGLFSFCCGREREGKRGRSTTEDLEKMNDNVCAGRSLRASLDSTKGLLLCACSQRRTAQRRNRGGTLCVCGTLCVQGQAQPQLPSTYSPLLHSSVQCFGCHACFSSCAVSGVTLRTSRRQHSSRAVRAHRFWSSSRVGDSMRR